MGPQANCRFETVKVRLKFGMYRCICLTTPHQNCTPPLVFIPSRLHGRLAKSPYHHRIHRYSYGIFSHRRLYLRSGPRGSYCRRRLHVEATISDKFKARTRLEDKEWSWSQRNFHVNNSKDLSFATNTLIDTMINEDSVRDLKASLITRELVALLLRTGAKNFLLENAMALHMSHRLAYAIHYIRTNITSEIHVEELADKACLSRAQFFRAFKYEIGMTPVQFINSERIARAKRALKKPSMSLSDAAIYAGFKSQSYFNRVFKAFTGTTPQAFRMSNSMFAV
jgi:AraC-like DNA-binding protein